MQHIAAFLFIALPWLNPFAVGPQPAVPQQLFAWSCVAGLLAIWGRPAKLTSARHRAPPVAQAWLAAALASAVLGLLQFFGLTGGLDPWVNSTSVGEAFANLRQRNQFATLTSIGLMGLLWQVAQWRPDSTDGPTESAELRVPWTLWLAGAAQLAMGNAVSGSRTGLLQWCLVLALLVMWRKRLHWRTLTVGVVSVALYFVAIRAMPWLLEETTGVHAAGLLGRFNEETGCSSRRILWANVLHLIAQKPWLGWGWGELDYAHFITLYPGERFCDILDNAHNLPLHLAVELGVPFAAVACAFVLWLVLRTKPWSEADPTRQMAWAVLAVIGLHSLLEYPLWYGPFQIAAGLCVWLLWRNPGAARVLPLNFTSFRPLAPVWTAWAASVLIAICTYAAWDYWRVSQLYLLPAQRSSIYRDNTLDKLRGSWLFSNQVQFAELTTTSTTADNSVQVLEQALQLLHFSPEPRVIEKLIESAVLLGRDDEAAYFLVRYRAAFPEAYARWAAESSSYKAP
ncbi:MAG: Wzy polymerase domain-containing protein [Burkholderiales bacterium]